MYLRNQQVRFFRDTGYLKLNDVVSKEDLSEMMLVIASHVQNRIKPYRTSPSGDIVKLDAIVSRDPVFLRVIQAPLMSDPLRSILGPNVELKLNRHNHVQSMHQATINTDCIAMSFNALAIW